MKDKATGHAESAGNRSSPMMTRRAFLGAAAFVAAAGVAFGANGFTEPFRLQRTFIRVPIRDLPAEFAGYRIGQLSDLHLPWNMTAGFIQRALRALEKMKPDVVVLTGDLVDEKGEAEARNLAGIFDDCSAPDGVLAVLGNHDNWFAGDVVRKHLARDTPIRLLDHDHVIITRGQTRLAIGGVGDLWTQKVELEKTFVGLPGDVPRILLSHNPDVAEILHHTGIRVDLQLSGHTHGGEVVIPFAGPPVVPSRYGKKYASGFVQGPGWPVYVNRGLCAPHFVRFACRPEITCIELVTA